MMVHVSQPSFRGSQRCLLVKQSDQARASTVRRNLLGDIRSCARESTVWAVAAYQPSMIAIIDGNLTSKEASISVLSFGVSITQHDRVWRLLAPFDCRCP